jgi:hydroxymethylbilane synthase
LSTTGTLRIGTRGSRLALWQANTVSALLASSGLASELVVIKTTGDRSQAGPVPGDDTKRQFVKEIEEALLASQVDLAVHSAKDLPAVLPEGLVVAACLEREDPRDAIVLPQGTPASGWTAVLDLLNRPGASPRVGTGSVRRIAQLAQIFPEARFAPIRGNVDTRLNKLDADGFDALVLACAGLRRLGFEGRISAAVSIELCVPAPGQGIVAIETRSDDRPTRDMLQRIGNEAASGALQAERAVVETLGGGCQLPLGAIATRRDAELEMIGVVASRDGSRSIRRTAHGRADAPAALGQRLAAALAEAGAQELLEDKDQ